MKPNNWTVWSERVRRLNSPAIDLTDQLKPHQTDLARQCFQIQENLQTLSNLKCPIKIWVFKIFASAVHFHTYPVLNSKIKIKFAIKKLTMITRCNFQIRNLMQYTSAIYTHIFSLLEIQPCWKEVKINLLLHNTRFAIINSVYLKLFFSFAQWRYRSQWGSTEARLLLVENFSQYPPSSTNVGHGICVRSLKGANN